jgi:putative PIN family toxin of toxin-antitoxin system
LSRFVLDANTLASGSIDPRGESPPRLLYQELAELRFEAIVCPGLLEEIARTLCKPYFLERAGGSRGVEDIVAAITQAAIVVEDPIDPKPLLRDSDDDYLVALAREAKAEAIVTGDKDLLDHDGLNPPAITPREACVRLGLIAPSPGSATTSVLALAAIRRVHTGRAQWPDRPRPPTTGRADRLAT